MQSLAVFMKKIMRHMNKPYFRGLFWHPPYWVQNYKIATEFEIEFAEKHFSKISNMLRAEVREMKPTKQANDWILHATTQNPMLSNWKDWLGNTCLSCILIVTLKTYFGKILSVRLLRKIEILEKYYLHHCILDIKIKSNLVSKKTMDSVAFVKII